MSFQILLVGLTLERPLKNVAKNGNFGTNKSYGTYFGLFIVK